jgi:hypothetical protein
VLKKRNACSTPHQRHRVTLPIGRGLRRAVLLYVARRRLAPRGPRPLDNLLPRQPPPTRPGAIPNAPSRRPRGPPNHRPARPTQQYKLQRRVERPIVHTRGSGIPSVPWTVYGLGFKPCICGGCDANESTTEKRDAGQLHVRVCAGGFWQQRLLP